jgi:hypothetical protein
MHVMPQHLEDNIGAIEENQKEHKFMDINC